MSDFELGLRINADASGMRRGLEEANRGLSALKIGATAAAAGVAAMGAFVADATADLMTMSRELKATSQAFNVSTQSIQVWQSAAAGVGIESDKMSDIFKDVNDKLGDLATTGGGEAKDLFEQLNLNIKDFKNLSPDQALLKIGAAMDKSKLTQSQKVFLLEGLADDASKLLPLLENNGKSLADIKAKAEKAGVILTEKDKKLLDEANAQLSEMGMAWKGITTSVGLAGAAIFTAFGPELTDGLQAVAEVVKTVSVAIQSGDWSLLPGAGEITASVSAFQAGINSMMATVSNSDIGQAISTVVADVSAGMTGIFADLNAAFQEVWSVIGPTVTKMWQGVQTVFSTYIDITSALFTGFVTALGAILSGGYENLKAVTIALWESLKALYSTGWEVIKAVVSTGWQALKALFTDGVSASLAILVTLPSKIFEIFSGLAGRMAEIGRNLLQGLANGMTEAVSGAIAAAKKAASAVVDTITGVFDVHSPSRVMYTIGGFVTEGLANGIRDGSTKASKEAARAAKAVEREMLKAQKAAKREAEKLAKAQAKDADRKRLKPVDLDPMAKHWDKTMQSMEGGFQRVFAGVMTGTMTMGQAMRGLFAAVAESVINTLAQIGAQWLTAKISQTLLGKSSALANVNANAAAAGSGAYAATAAIPVIGPAMAPAAAAAAYSGAMSFASVASAARGFDIPAGVNPLTQLHEREMVLPAKHADTIRNLEAGAGGAINFHITATDARSVRRLLQNEGGALVDSLKGQARNFRGLKR